MYIIESVKLFNFFRYGEGIGFTICGVAFLITYILVLVFDLAFPMLIVLVFSLPFMLSWIIVGGVSLWAHGLDCQQLVPELYTFSTICVVYFCAYIPLFIAGLPFAIFGN